MWLLLGSFFSGFYIAFYELAKRGIGEDTNFFQTTVSASFASILATFITHPFDVLRTNIQLGLI